MLVGQQLRLGCAKLLGLDEILVSLIVCRIRIALGLKRPGSRQAQDRRRRDLVRVRAGHALGRRAELAVDGHAVVARDRGRDGTASRRGRSDCALRGLVAAEIHGRALRVDRIRPDERRRKGFEVVQRALT